ncbi:MarR family winged helix-turn-helix transcriptional regulator [Brevibacterium oceani]|uniref:MarR family winged helix-turn-helix transcriptional regulator n=1 Tax=Brevibacterium oceani TaxID=358099 RepID=UPI001FE6EBF1|nr:MarR family winged helix-turn-helix transcriptional regulator [Brevibacterium oceani]
MSMSESTDPSPMTDPSETTDPSQANAHQVAVDLRAVLARLIRRLRETTLEDSLTPSQASALSRLSKGGVSTVAALAHAEKVRPQSMAATVESLESRGFLTRSPDPTDGRRQIVDLTDAGWQQVEGQREAGLAWLDHSLAEEVTHAELMTLAESSRILARILDR